MGGCGGCAWRRGLLLLRALTHSRACVRAHPLSRDAQEGEEVGKGQGAVACGRPSGAQGAGTAHAATSSELSDMEAGFSGGNADGAWRVVEGPLLFVWVKNTQWDAEDVKPAPRARLADGCVDLLYMRAPVSRWRLLRLFLQLEVRHVPDAWQARGVARAPFSARTSTPLARAC